MKKKIKNTAANSSATYRIPVIWEMIGIKEIEASSLGEAIRLARDIPRPKHGEFVKGSLKTDPEFNSCMK